ncbi:MAG: hypothetical protein M0R33_21010 [Methylomonas sp.]|jgi:hypothetical protein|uniref:hypothetical protein n=1 Tax=Methylomonas sp. TaxID=418 RepID=UPI0025EEB6B2|nr:hypothetical protein [Methylomonas sp.]MCK9608928.1 hypothetical protein [Methylomonas sp.]
MTKLSLNKLIIFPLCLSLSACTWFEPNPYADFSVGDVDEDGPDREAAILVGNPQVISRERLINDRNSEKESIENLLNLAKCEIDGTKGVKCYPEFKSQINRDLKVINSFASQMGIAFDPSLGKAFERQNDINELQNEIELRNLKNQIDINEFQNEVVLLKLKNQIDQVKKLIETDPGNAALQPGSGSQDGNEGDGNNVGNEGDGNKPPQRPDLTGLTGTGGAISRLQSTIDSLLTNGATEVNRKAGKSEILSTPEEYFEDLTAYRARLRQRLAEVSLDDAHDVNGNTLYRLQFNATVLPGEVKNKFGVLDFEIGGGEVVDVDKELQVFYYFWLDSLNDNYLSISFASPIKLNAFKRMIDSFEKNGLLIACRDQSGNNIERYIAANQLCPVSSSFSVNIVDNIKKFPKNILQRIELLDEKTQNSAKEILQTINQYKDQTRDKNASIIFNPNYKVPEEFKKFLIEEKGEKSYWKAENLFTYQAQPAQRVQRLSTLASAANSMQSALAIAATLPQYGLGVDAGAAAARTAVGLADSVERTPLVIGYTDVNRNNNAHFGYVFGPKAILQPDENQLVYKQIPAAHSVFSDISVPAWLPSITLRTRTAWVGNWHTGREALKTYVSNQKLHVPLRPKKAAYDEFTNYLYASSVFSAINEEVTVDAVFPEVVYCDVNTDLFFTIKGKNLWRNPVITFYGNKLDVEAVLPDMEGLLIKVNPSSLKNIPKNGSINGLNIVTSFGQATIPKDLKIVPENCVIE